MPKLESKGVKLFFVSIGTHSRSIEFHEVGHWAAWGVGNMVSLL
jgi:hypothetical protein